MLLSQREIRSSNLAQRFLKNGKDLLLNKASFHTVCFLYMCWKLAVRYVSSSLLCTKDCVAKHLLRVELIHTLHRHSKYYSCVHKVDMSPTFNGSSVLESMHQTQQCVRNIQCNSISFYEPIFNFLSETAT